MKRWLDSTDSTYEGTVTWWYRAGLFNTKEEAVGAFKFAHMKALRAFEVGNNKHDAASRMGLAPAEFESWCRHEELPQLMHWQGKVRAMDRVMASESYDEEQSKKENKL